MVSAYQFLGLATEFVAALSADAGNTQEDPGEKNVTHPTILAYPPLSMPLGAVGSSFGLQAEVFFISSLWLDGGSLETSVAEYWTKLKR